jgi:hypothetical protein
MASTEGTNHGKSDNEEMAEDDPVVLSVRGEYQSPAGFSREDEEHFSTNLARFLFEGVSRISNYKSFVEKKTVLFDAEFQMRAGWGEQFLFNLVHWPLGVKRLQFV